MGLIPQHPDLFEVTAAGSGDGRPILVEVTLHSAPRPTREAALAEASAILAGFGFPKSVGLRASIMYAQRGVVPTVGMTAYLIADGVNGGRNETGIARYRRFVAYAERHGIPFVYRAGYGNSYPTREAFEAALAR